MATQIQITLRTTDNVSENFIVNQFACSDNVASPTDANSVRDAFRTFYSSLATNSVISGVIAQNNHTCKLYLAPGIKPNYPYYESSFNLTTAPSGTSLPSEVAHCISFQGTRTAGQPQARRRGRVYIGPLQSGVNSLGRPSTASITAMLNAFEALYDAVDLVPSAGLLSVWSPSNGQAVPLVEAWCDDAFDTQRSRGLTRTARTVRALI